MPAQAAAPNAPACPLDPAAPPRMVLNHRVHDIATAANRAGLDLPGLPEIRHWALHVPPLAVHLVAPALAAQGNDLARGLLAFAEGKPVRRDDGTAGWLAAQVASCFGRAGQDEAEQLDWAEERRDLWRRIAADPLANREWAEAPRPWSALAAAFEYGDWLRHDRIEFVSHLPVTLTPLQLSNEKQCIAALSDTAVFCVAAAAAAHGLAFVPFGESLYATRAGDAWFLRPASADAFHLLGRLAWSGSQDPGPPKPFSPIPPASM